MPDMQAITEQIKTDNEPRLCLCGCGRPVRGNDRRSLYASEACAIKVRNKRWGERYPIATRFCAYAGCECKRHGKSKFCSKHAHHPVYSPVVQVYKDNIRAARKPPHKGAVVYYRDGASPDSMTKSEAMSCYQHHEFRSGDRIEFADGTPTIEVR